MYELSSRTIAGFYAILLKMAHMATSSFNSWLFQEDNYRIRIISFQSEPRNYHFYKFRFNWNLSRTILFISSIQILSRKCFIYTSISLAPSYSLRRNIGIHESKMSAKILIQQSKTHRILFYVYNNSTIKCIHIQKSAESKSTLTFEI